MIGVDGPPSPQRSAVRLEVPCTVPSPLLQPSGPSDSHAGPMFMLKGALGCSHNLGGFDVASQGVPCPVLLHWSRAAAISVGFARGIGLGRGQRGAGSFRKCQQWNTQDPGIPGSMKNPRHTGNHLSDPGYSPAHGIPRTREYPAHGIPRTHGIPHVFGSAHRGTRPTQCS